MTLQNPAIILVKPQLGENIGMCARAMLNCGFTDLRIVSPRDGWPSESAVSASAGALDSGVVARVYDTTSDAIADLGYVLATTARPRDMVKDVYTPRQSAQQMAQSGVPCGVLFGAERSGLDNNDVALASGVITIPLNAGFTSLNLAQAVLLVTYEWFTRQDDTPAYHMFKGDSDAATLGDIAGLVGRLETEMDNGGFFRSPELRPTLVRNLHALFARTRMTEQEVSTFHGIITCLIRNRD